MRRAALVTIAVLCCVAPPAEATYPGKNGKIAYYSNRAGMYNIWVMNPDGSGRTQLTHSSTVERHPAWSPDGSRIAFARHSGSNSDDLWIMNADGSGQSATGAKCYNAFFNDIYGISWSADGSRIAFGCYWDGTRADGYYMVFTDPTGQNVTSGAGIYPDYSPDGRTLAYYDPDRGDLRLRGLDAGTTTPVPNPPGQSLRYPSWSPDNSVLAAQTLTALWTVKPDGSDAAQIQSQGTQPSWSPDGSRIAYVGGGKIHTVRPDGTGTQSLTDGGSGLEQNPDWQPIPINSYPRPRDAAAVEVPLVPSYIPCTSPNREHGPPLAFGSCNPATKASNEVTLGTPDANAKLAKGSGRVRFSVAGGDVRLSFEAYDLYDHTTLADYTGELRLRTPLQITDKQNVPHPGAPGAATVSGTALGATVPCAATSDQTEGAQCHLITTVNSLIPGAVQSGKRSVWALGKVRVYDDSTLFMVQGVFVP